MLSHFLFYLTCVLLFSHSEARLKIVSPDNLRLEFTNTEDNDIPYQIARYGEVPYGSNLIGTLVLSDPVTGCSTSDLTTDEDAAKIKAPIYIMRRGGCKFVMKTRNSQFAGAKMLIIVDSENEPLGQTFGGAALSSDIHIPTILIPYEQGNKIITYLEENSDKLNDSPAMISLYFPMKSDSSDVVIDFWFSTGDPTSQVYDFLRDFRSYFSQADEYITFKPHYITWPCLPCKAHGFKAPSPDCISGGRYCAPDPDQSGPLTGVNVVYENLRQICVLQKDEELWWNYVSSFGERCKSKPDQEECARDLLIDAGAHNSRREEINDCMHKSFLNEGNEKVDDNKILAQEWRSQEEHDISFSPSVFIGNEPYHGSVDAVSVLKVVCEKIDNQPGPCHQFKPTTTVINSLSIKTILITITIMTLMILVILYFYRRMQRREMTKEMSLQVSQMVSQYLELSDSRDHRI